MEQNDIIAQVVAYANTKEGLEAISKRLLRPADPSLPDPNDTKILKDYSQSYKSLSDGFVYGGEGDVKEWLEGELFKPDWDVYLNALDSSKEAAGSTKNWPIFDSDFQTVMDQINDGERHGHARYSRSRPDKTNWAALDHLAFFMFCCHRENKNRRNGILYTKQWHRLEEYWAVWQAKRFMTKKVNDTRMGQAYGLL